MARGQEIGLTRSGESHRYDSRGKRTNIYIIKRNEKRTFMSGENRRRDGKWKWSREGDKYENILAHLAIGKKKDNNTRRRQWLTLFVIICE